VSLFISILFISAEFAYVPRSHVYDSFAPNHSLFETHSDSVKFL